MARQRDPDGRFPPTGQDVGREPSLHQLRLFLVLAEEMHFGRAAARLYMTQPAFSQQIRALEQRLGVPLVERTSRSVHLAAAGRELVPEARAVVESMARLRHLADIHAREVSGNLTVGFIAGEAAMPYTHAILEELHARHPRIVIEMRSLTFVDQIEALSCGTVDAAFLRPPLPDGLQTLHLATEARIACLSTGDRLATGAPVTLEQLGDHAVVDFPPQTPGEWWDYWAVNPRPDGAQVRRGPVARDVEALLHIVSRGQAISFLPAAARHLYPRPGVAFVEVTDAPASTAALAWHPRNRDQPPVRALRAAARATLA
ncbi:LysR family transcriptional regulator [Streptomyces sp. NPDC049040]|uniref:LysR family transcriptional regulator n=1 Tax=Streptomyces sp. NPDC049040 TaxID=3365593 RepID=UPI003722E7BE